MAIKSGVRSIGIDDGPFDRSARGDVLAVAAVYRGGTWFDGLLTTKIRKDGFNATDKIAQMIVASKFHAQLHYILLDGIALGGFNIIDIHRLHQKTQLKVLAIMRRKPNLAAMRRAIGCLTQPERRWHLVQKAGPIVPLGQVYAQLSGLAAPEATELLALTCSRSLLPEPLRAAHLIAGGLVKGQSGRGA
ncbi:MAG: DUF99 family protein [Myxococcota bacterium]|nr:DUF99 family protein [Myxococcota bacterium]